MSTWDLTDSESRIVKNLREVDQVHENYALKVFGQGSVKRRVRDLEVTYRVRLEERRPLSAVVDD